MRIAHARVLLSLPAAAGVLALASSGASGGAFAGGNGKLAYSDGSGKVVVDGTAVASGGNPSWNGEGTKVAFASGGAIEIDTLGGSAGSTGLSGSDPSFSPDGSKLAYVRGGEIYVANADGTGETDVTNSGADDEAPAWSPDGTKIAFARGTAASHAIWVMAADGSGQTQLTTGSADDTDPSWSPSGGTIAFDSTRDGPTPAHQIYTVPAAGGSVTRVTNTTEDDREPAFTPDGTAILFAWTTGTAGIYSLPAGGGTASLVAAGSNRAPDEQPTVRAGTPFVSGFANAGSVLSASPGTWSGVNVAFSYQWQRCDSTSFCVNVGTNATTYTTVAADVGESIQVVVTGANGASSATATSAPVGPVTAGPGPVDTVLPSIVLPTGFDAPQIGFFLSALPGTWTGVSPITFTYQWTKCDLAVAALPCYDIPNATTSFFTPTAELAHWGLSVTVTATNSAGTTYVRALPTKAVTGEAPTNHGSPRITGDNFVASTLVSDTGTWRGLAPITYAYQWKRCDAFGDLESCVAIPGATTNAYVLQDADLDKTIRVFVTATNPVASVTQFSNHTFPTLPERHFAPSAVVEPVVSGTPKPGFLLRTTPGTWSGDAPIRLRYQWQRCDATGANCVPIRGATRDRYTVRRVDLGATLGSKVTATNAYGTTSAESSDVTDPVTGSPRVPRGRRIVGTQHADYIGGGGGNDVLIGLGGNDTIMGGAGRDRIDGGPGNDVLDGGPGSDVIDGGPGSDTILATDGYVDTIDCGPGNDRAVVDSEDKVVNCESVIVKPSDTGGTGSTAP